MMHIDLAFLAHHAFHLSATLPGGFQGPVLRGSKVMNANGPAGSIILQEIVSAGFRIQFSILHFLKPFNLAFQSGNHYLQSLYSFKHDFNLTLDDKAIIRLLQDQFLMAHILSPGATVHFEKNQDYRLMEVCYEESLIRELHENYSPLDSLMAATNETQPFILSKPQWLAPEAKYILKQIFDSKFEERLQPYYLNLKIKEYLLNLVQQIYQPPPSTISLSPDEVERIQEVGNFLQTQFNLFYTTPQLAKMAFMNEYKFKIGFKQIFGKPAFEYQRDCRLTEAKRLLMETNIQVGEVFALVGYQRVTSFVSEFRKHFGYPPGSIKHSH